jgi:hypothetical protein
VIPTKAANLTMLEKTTSSVLIQWSVVFPMQNFPPGVDQRVEYQSEWDARDKWTVNTVELRYLNLKGPDIWIIHCSNYTEIRITKVPMILIEIRLNLQV